MDTLDPRVLQELVDREKIRQVFYRYAFGVDTSDPEAVLSVFDDPCTLIVHFEPGAPAKTYEGRGAVERFFRKGLSNDLKLLRHRISNHLVELNSDEARARVYWDEIREQQGKLILGGGTYLDKLRRVGDGWKLCEREAYADHWITLIDDIEQPAHNDQVRLAPRIRGIFGHPPV